MKTKIFGRKYIYSIEYSQNKNYYYEIWAFYKKTGQVSCITNLNYILSSYSTIFNDINKYYETTWEFKDEYEVITIYTYAIKLFNCKDFIKILEYELDEDRNIGGWNSEYRF